MLSVGVAPKAAAQMAVIDSANLGQNIQTAAQSIIAVEQLKAQLSQLEQTYQMFTNPTNVLGMAAGMENQSIENPMPMANAMPGLIGGTTAPSGAAASYFNQNHVYGPTDGSAASAQLNANGNAIANIEGIASTNLTAIQQRMQDLPNLESDLNAATSITQVDAINGRIAAESQFVQAQQAQAQNLQVLASEQASSQQQQQKEQFVEDMTNASSDYSQAAAADNTGQ
ncbi:type IV secretion system protein [Acidocella sp.]|uniref:type IV secretion system protein n=1 Tax=Acidocella sp. TaxID=50710 RepID=UPI0026298980|nr:type IV secretion system protein [Acidocella sp.]